jgi:hypothetical protein
MAKQAIQPLEQPSEQPSENNTPDTPTGVKVIKPNLPKGIDTIMQSIQNDREKFKVTVDIPPAVDMLPEETCNSILNQMAIKNNCSLELATIGTVLLIQNGGTNLSKKSLKSTIYETTFCIDDLRAIIKSTDRTATVRKFAKSIRDIIISISEINGWPGPLRNTIKINNPNLEIPDNLSIWCLEVHSDNPKCPQIIKECLIRREEQLKASQQMQLQKGNPKPRNQRGKGKKK